MKLRRALLGSRMIVLLLIVGTVLAGCSSKGKDCEPGSADCQDPSQVTPTFSDQTGAIEGFVVDEADLPIAGVDVDLEEIAGSVTQTGADGRFVFSELAPGTYTLRAAALRYEAARMNVEVTAGSISTAQLTLTDAAVAGVAHQVVVGPLPGRLFCGFYVGNSGENLLAGPCKPVSFTDEDNPVEQAWGQVSDHENNIWELADIIDSNKTNEEDVFSGVVVEISWTPTQAASTQLQATIEEYAETRSGDEAVYAYAAGPSVLKLMAVPGVTSESADSSIDEDENSLGLGVFPYHQSDPASAYTSQNFEIWITLFYNGAPLPDYTVFT